MPPSLHRADDNNTFNGEDIGDLEVRRPLSSRGSVRGWDMYEGKDVNFNHMKTCFLRYALTELNLYSPSTPQPGNPYFVRFVLVNSADGSEHAGPETVFDTKPVDCTPKTEKKCVIS